MDLFKLEDKHISELNTKELIDVFLIERTEPLQFKNHEVKTTLSITLESIEKNIGKLSTRNVLPIIGIFSVFDMLGSSFDRTDKTTTANAPIKRALNLYSSLKEYPQDIDALYGLRNSLVHNSSLVSLSIRPNQKNYIFRYDSNQSTLIKHSPSDWNGDFEELDGNQDKYTTIINIFKLHTLMKDCIDKVRQLNLENKIALRYGSNRELYYHYFRSIRNSLSAKQLEKVQPTFEKCKKKVEEHIKAVTKFTMVVLGDNDSYTFSRAHQIVQIASHSERLYMDELKKYLVKAFASNEKYERDLALFYRLSEMNSSKHHLKLLISS